MQSLRQASSIARLVLAWFALALGVAIASPLVKPQTLQLICSGSGAMQLLVKAGDAGEPATTHTFDCPLCTAVAPPPPALQALAPQQLPEPLAQPIAVRRAAQAAAPLPARGPPAHPLA